MTLSFLQKVWLSFFGGGLEFFKNGQKISLVYTFVFSKTLDKPMILLFYNHEMMFDLTF